jgi:hypothetical protein
MDTFISENKIIHGDNLEALKNLLSHYEGRIGVSKLTLHIIQAMSARVKIGNAENKKRAAIFLSCSYFGFKWSVEWSFFSSECNIPKQQSKRFERNRI